MALILFGVLFLGVSDTQLVPPLLSTIAGQFHVTPGQAGIIVTSYSLAAAVFALFAGLALLLACIGVYSVLAYLTAQRVPEIGVRLALGASARGVMWLVLRQSLWMIVVGVGAGVLGALPASTVPAFRASRVDPLTALRRE